MPANPRRSASIRLPRVEYRLDGLKRLHLAIVLQAISDFRQKPDDLYLQKWLLVDGLHILEAYEQPISPDGWREFVNAGCPFEGSFRIARQANR